MTTYRYPELYTPESDDPPYCCIKGNKQYEITATRKASTCMGSTILESSLQQLIDTENSTVKTEYCLHIPSKKKTLHIKSGTPLTLVEVSGVQVVLTSHEGDYVKKGQIIAHTVTGKSESRTIRSPTTGILVYIGVKSFSNPETYLIALAGEEHVDELRGA